MPNPLRARRRVRLFGTVEDAAALSDHLAGLDRDQAQPLLDQLWLRAVMLEQWRRTSRSERDDFERRADRILAQLDSQADDV